MEYKPSEYPFVFIAIFHFIKISMEGIRTGKKLREKIGIL
jgi:hypothetical protein